MQRQNRTTAWWMIPILLLAAGLRVHLLTADIRLHPDEALFATFARDAAIKGEWMLLGALDKPPLAIYSMALSMVVWGDGEFAARLPGMFGSLMLVAVTIGLAQQLYGRRTGLIAGALMAVSPYAVAFSAVAFTDTLMLTFAGLGLLAAAHRRVLWAGIGMGLAFACKPQALYLLPVAWGLAGMRGRDLARLLVPVALCAGVIAAWDAARGPYSGLWALAAANNNPARLIRANEVIPRLRAWVAYGGLLAGETWAGWGILAAALVAFVDRVRRGEVSWGVVTDCGLMVSLAVYMGLHWLVAFNTYDRYLLPVLIPVILLAARGVFWLWAVRRWWARAIVLVLAVGSLRGGWAAAEGRSGIGGDAGRHDGIIALAAWLNDRALGAIVYDYYLGWELGYYLGPWSDLRRVYYPTPSAQARGAAEQADLAPRYFPAPADRPVGPWLDALREAGFAVRLAYVGEGFVVYAVERQD